MSKENLASTSPPAKPGVKTLRSSELFADCSRVDILHGSTCYRLQLTRQGKLILTK